MANPFTHIELNSNDLPTSKAFYQKMFDWQYQDLPNMPYTLITAGSGPGGGMQKNPMPGAPTAWLAYVGVADLVAATAKAKALGATVLQDVTPVPGFGSLSIIADPAGAVLGLWQASS